MNLQHIEQNLKIDPLLVSSYSYDIHELHLQLSELAQLPQWIMFTAQCPRRHILELSSKQSWSNKAVHLLPSRALSESDVIEKAIYSGNASAVVASSKIPNVQQSRLYILAEIYDCQLFFIDPISPLLH